MYVKPAPERLVRDPVTLRPLPDEGAEVRATDLFWERALRDEDVVEAPAPAAPAEEPHA